MEAVVDRARKTPKTRATTITTTPISNSTLAMNSTFHIPHFTFYSHIFPRTCTSAALDQTLELKVFLYNHTIHTYSYHTIAYLFCPPRFPTLSHSYSLLLPATRTQP